MFHKSIQKILDWSPDIIHSQSEFTSFIIAKKIAAAVNCPIVHTYHTVYENYTHYFSPSIALGRKAVMMLTRRVLDNTKAVIAPTDKIKTMLEGYGVSQPIKVVSTGLRLEKFTQPASADKLAELKSSLHILQENKVLVTVGRAACEKNIEELIRYFDKLDMPQVTFVIVGGGPYLEELKAIAAEVGSRENIIFTGAVSPDEVPMYYQLGDVFLSASQSETQGLTYIEALASGLPAVCRADECLKGR